MDAVGTAGRLIRRAQDCLGVWAGPSSTVTGSLPCLGLPPPLPRHPQPPLPRHPQPSLPAIPSRRCPAASQLTPAGHPRHSPSSRLFPALAVPSPWTASHPGTRRPCSPGVPAAPPLFALFPGVPAPLFRRCSRDTPVSHRGGCAHQGVCGGGPGLPGASSEHGRRARPPGKRECGRRAGPPRRPGRRECGCRIRATEASREHGRRNNDGKTPGLSEEAAGIGSMTRRSPAGTGRPHRRESGPRAGPTEFASAECRSHPSWAYPALGSIGVSGFRGCNKSPRTADGERSRG
jgi:hypothetical protein